MTVFRRRSAATLLASAVLLLLPAGLAGQAAADSAFRADDRDRARELYREHLQEEPNDRRVLYRLGLLAGWADDFEASLEYFDRLLELAPDRQDVATSRARVLAWSGRREAAIDTLRGITRNHPDYAVAYRTLGRILGWEDRHSEAAEALERAARLAPDDGETRRLLASSLESAGRTDAAVRELLSYLDRHPGDSATRFVLAGLYQQSGRHEQAVQQYGQLVSADPARAHVGMARSHIERGRYPAAEASLRAAVQADPDDPDLRVQLARVLRWQGRNDAAADEITRARRIDPGVGREEQSWVHRFLGPQIRLYGSAAEDSDGNEMDRLSAEAAATLFGRLQLSVGGSVVNHEQVTSTFSIAREAWAGEGEIWVQLPPGWELWAGVGRTDFDDADGPADQEIVTYHGGLSTPGREPVRLRLTYGHEALDYTAVLLRERVERDRVEADLRWRASRDLRISADASWADYQGDEENSALRGSLGADLDLGGSFELGLETRAYGFREDVNDGYFDPELYVRNQASLTWRPSLGALHLLFRASPGVRWLEREAEPGEWGLTFGGDAEATLRLAPGRELSLSTGFSRSEGQIFGTSAEGYEYYGASLGLRWVF